MKVNSEHVYRDAVTAHRLPQGISVVHAVESAQHLSAAERTAVQSTLFTAFDGLPRRHSAMPVRADFLRQVRFPVATGSFASEYASAAR